VVRRGGFTLVEVMVALVVIGVVVLGARVMLGQVAGDAERIAAAAAEADREGNADRLLRDVVGRLETSAAPGRRATFEGDARSARFHSWCEVPDGWLERCEATLAFVEVEGAPALALRLSGGEPLALRRGFGAGELIYLRDAAEGGRWVLRWGESLTAPIAFGVVIDGDTAIVRVGERG
jgi:prepilin-type N-terminal cleavage/methylation domain-containing protein